MARIYRRWGATPPPNGKTEVARYLMKEEKPHDLEPGQIRMLEKKAEAMGVAEQARSIKMTRNAVQDMLPDGYTLDPMRKRAQVMPGGAMTGGGNTMFSAMQPFQPEFSSPDRQMYPVHRRLANCFVADTPVVLADGTICPIQNIKVGDRVLDRYGREATVEAAWSEPAPDSLVKLRLWGGKEFTCTPNHKWPVWAWPRTCACGCGKKVTPGRAYTRGHNTKRGDTVKPLTQLRGPTAKVQALPQGFEPRQELEACAIARGDRLMVPRYAQEQEANISLRDARLLGYYVAEGSGVDRNTHTVWALHEKERDTLAADIADICQDWGVTTKIKPVKGSKGIQIYSVGDLRTGEGKAQALQHWLQLHGGAGSAEKKLSPDAMHWPRGHKIEFLRGLFRGDGHRSWRTRTKVDVDSEYFRVEYVTVSASLASQVFSLMAQLGFAARRYVRPAGVNKLGFNQHEAYFMSLSGEQAREFAHIVWGVDSKAEDRQAKHAFTGPLMDDDFIYLEVKEVEVIPRGDQELVYNLTVSGDHSYQVDGIATFNSYWRLFYKMDPVIGSVIDMFADLPWSDFQLTGEGVDGEVKETLEHMIKETKLMSMLPYFVREFFILGEVLPHMFFDDTKGIWTHIAMHNPDQVNVVYSPFVRMDPVIEFVPDQKLREVVTSRHPMLARVRETMPDDLVSALSSGQNIPLSPINASFIARKLHPYDLRGTSIISRLWRTLMLEDALWSATIQTAKRAACFVSGTPVLTADGLQPIEQIVPGTKVISGTGSIETVEASWSEQATDGLVEIKVLGTQALTCTPNHKFLAWVAPRQCACGCGKDLPIALRKDGRKASGRKTFISGHHLAVTREKKSGRSQAGVACAWTTYSESPNVRALASYQPLQKVEASSLRKGDYLVIPRTFAEKPTDCLPAAARLLGYYAAEGGERNVRSKTSGDVRCAGVCLTFSLAEHETWAQDAMLCARSLGLNPTIYRYVPGEQTKMALSGREGRTSVYLQKQADEPFAAWLKLHAGVGANYHKLTEEVMSWPLRLKEELVRGYFRGDGHFGFVSDCPQVCAVSTSQTLIYQLRLMLAQLGIFASISYSPTNDLGEENWSDQWILSSTGRDARRLAQIVWGIDCQELERPGKNTKGSRTWMDDTYIYVPVQSINILPSSRTEVYNLTVSGDHSYLAEAVQTFNSPIKMALLGDPATNTMVPPSEERRVLQMLAQAETDPQAWIVYNQQLRLEMAGDPGRIMSINQHYELIERIKLVALGVSKSFVSGETSYSCFLPGTPVTMSTGLSQPIETVRTGDKVLSASGAVQTVEANWNEEAPEYITEIDLWGQREPLRVTDNHKWPVWAWPRTCACGCGEAIDPGKGYVKDHYTRAGGRWSDVTPKLLYVDGEIAPGGKPRRIPEGYEPYQTLTSTELRVGDCLLIPRTFEEWPTADTESFARLLGYYVAEGSFIKNKNTRAIDGVRFSFNSTEAHTWASDVVNLLRTCGLPTTGVHVYEDRSTSVVNSQDSTNDTYRRIQALAGEYSLSKVLAPEIMHWPLSLKRELVTGMLRGDGHQGCNLALDKRTGNTAKQFSVAYSTVSKGLAQQLKTLLAQLGFFATIHVQDPKEMRKRGKNPGLGSELRYLTFVYGEHARELSRLVWKDASVAPVREMHYRDRYRVTDSFIHVPIKAIRRVPNTQEVYNLTISKDHSYQVHGGLGTYNSAASGLTVFLQRLKALREFFVNEWMIPKFFLPVAVINGWIRPEKAQANKGQLRVKRSALDLSENNRYIIPTIEWKKSLDPDIDRERMEAMTALEQNLGIKLSDQRKFAVIGLDNEEEQRKIVKETKWKKDLVGNDPLLAGAIGLGGAEGGGMGGGAMMPGLPGPGGGGGEGDMGDMPLDLGGPGGAPGGPEGPGGGGAPGGPGGGGGGAPGGEAPPSPEGASLTADAGSQAQPAKAASKYWNDTSISTLTNLFTNFDASEVDDAPWSEAMKDKAVREALLMEDPTELWLALETWMMDEGFPTSAVKDLEAHLISSKKIRRQALLEGIDIIGVAKQLGVTPDEMDASSFVTGYTPVKR